MKKWVILIPTEHGSTVFITVALSETSACDKAGIALELIPDDSWICQEFNKLLMQ